MLGDGRRAPLRVCEERDAQARLLEFIVLGRLVEFAVRQLVECDDHRLDPSSGIAKYVSSGATRQSARVQRLDSPLRLFGPDARVLVGCQLVEALQQTLG